MAATMGQDIGAAMRAVRSRSAALRKMGWWRRLLRGPEPASCVETLEVLLGQRPWSDVDTEDEDVEVPGMMETEAPVLAKNHRPDAWSLRQSLGVERGWLELTDLMGVLRLPGNIPKVFTCFCLL